MMVTAAQIFLALIALASLALAGVAMGESSAIARAQFALGGVAFVISLGFLGVLAALERARLDRKELIAEIVRLRHEFPLRKV